MRASERMQPFDNWPNHNPVIKLSNNESILNKQVRRKGFVEVSRTQDSE